MSCRSDGFDFTVIPLARTSRRLHPPGISCSGETTNIPACSRETIGMARWKHDRVTKYEGVNAIACFVVGLVLVVLAIAPVDPEPVSSVIAAMVALGFLGLGFHYASVWREKRSTR